MSQEMALWAHGDVGRESLVMQEGFINNILKNYIVNPKFRENLYWLPTIIAAFQDIS